MEQVLERCAGLDVHKKTVGVCVRVPGANGDRAQHVRTFGTTTAELLTLRDWLAAHGVTHVAMESRGVYWRPVVYVLEEAVIRILANAAQIAQVPGRKTDIRLTADAATSYESESESASASSESGAPLVRDAGRRGRRREGGRGFAVAVTSPDMSVSRLKPKRGTLMRLREAHRGFGFAVRRAATCVVNGVATASGYSSLDKDERRLRRKARANVMVRLMGSIFSPARKPWWLAAALLVIATVGAPPATAQNRLNHMIQVLANGGVAIGTIISGLTPPATIEALRVLPLDWVFIDMEHGPFEPRTLRDIVLAFRAADGSFPITPVVRVAANCSEIRYNQWQVKQVLDVGAAFGVILAHCDKREWTEDGVIAMRYPPFKNDTSPKPEGLRGWGPTGASIWGLTGAQYAQVADLWPLDPNGELLFIPMVESVGAINQLQAILSVRGVGGSFIGPADLHADMGFAGQSGVPEVEAQIQRALSIALRVGVPIGITTTAVDVQQRIDQGFRIVTIGGSPAAIADTLRALGR